MSVLKWPKVPFYIQNRTHRKRSRLRAVGRVLPDPIGFTGFLHLEALDPEASNLWVALPVGLSDGNEVACLAPCGVHMSSGTLNDSIQYALSCSIEPGGEASSELSISPIDPKNSGQWFILSGEQDKNGLNIKSAVDESMTVDCWLKDDGEYHVALSKANDGQSQTWSIIQDQGVLEAVSLSLPNILATGSIVSGDGSSVLIDNSENNTSVTTAVQLQYVDTETNTDTFSHQNSTSSTLESSLGLGGTIYQALTINLSGKVSVTETESTTFGKEHSVTKSQVYTQTLTVTVPPATRVCYTMTAQIGILPVVDITVRAIMHTSIPGASPFEVSIPGSYTGRRLLQLQVLSAPVVDPPASGDTLAAVRIPRTQSANHYAAVCGKSLARRISA